MGWPVQVHFVMSYDVIWCHCVMPWHHFTSLGKYTEKKDRTGEGHQCSWVFIYIDLEKPETACWNWEFFITDLQNHFWPLKFSAVGGGEYWSWGPKIFVHLSDDILRYWFNYCENLNTLTYFGKCYITINNNIWRVKQLQQMERIFSMLHLLHEVSTSHETFDLILPCDSGRDILFAKWWTMLSCCRKISCCFERHIMYNAN